MAKRVYFPITPNVIPNATTKLGRLLLRGQDVILPTYGDSTNVGVFANNPSTGYVDFDDNTPAADYDFVLAINGKFGYKNEPVTIGANPGAYSLWSASKSQLAANQDVRNITGGLTGTDAIPAAAISAPAVTKIQNNLATEQNATDNKTALSNAIVAMAAAATANKDEIIGVVTTGLDPATLALLFYERIVGSSIAMNNLPVVGTAITQTYNGDLNATFAIATASDDPLFLTIGYCKTLSMRVTSAAGLTDVAGLGSDDHAAASITRLDAERVEVMIRARALQKIYKSDSRVYQLEIRIVDGTDTIPRFMTDLSLLYSVGIDVAA